MGTWEKALNKTERFLGTDVNYLLNSGFWLAFSQIVASFSSLLLVIAFANFFPKESYGNYKYLLSLSGMVSAFALSGLSTGIIQSTARNSDGLFRRSFNLNLKWSFVTMLVAGGISAYYAWQGNEGLAFGALLIAIFLPLLSSSLLFKSFLNGKKEFKSLAIYSIFFNLLPVLAIIATITFSKNYVIILASYFISNTVVSLIIWLHVLKKYNPNDKIDNSSINFSKHMSLINILDTFATYLDKVLIFQGMGATQLAIYTMATSIPEQIRNSFKLIPTMAIPKLSVKTRSEIGKTITGKILKIFLLTIPIIVIYFFFAPLIYSVFFPNYPEAVNYSRFFVLILLVEGGLSGAVLKAQMLIKEQYILNFLTNILKITMMLFMVSVWGIWGIITARLVTRYFSFFLSLFLIKKNDL